MSYDDQEFKTSNKFLKIDAGAPAVIRLIDVDPVEIFKHKVSQNGQAVNGKFQIDCCGEEICPYCQNGDDPMQRFITNVYNHTLQKVQLWEYGTMQGKMLQAIARSLKEENLNILDRDLKIEATGAGLAKRYSITLRTGVQPLPTDIKRIKITNDPDVPF